MNAIFIHDLRVETRIGIYEWEKHARQTVRLDVELGLPSDEVFRTGDFADALDYAAVVRRLQAFAEVFNVPNVSTILQVNTRIGPLYMNPQLIEQPRHLQLGAQFDW